MTDAAFLIGPVKVTPPVVLAPMAGVTNPPFRLLCRQLGAGLVCSEMVSATALCYGSRRTLQMLEAEEGERPLSLQLFGADPERMAAAAELVCARSRADVLDINLGCTVPKVAKSGAGAALLADPARTEALVRAVVGASSLPVTVKLRARWRAGCPDAVELGQRLEQAGAAAITLHPRSACGKFSAPLEWDLVARLVRAVAVPVIANGDIRDAADARRVLEGTGARGIMVGRAALGNPWIFAELAELFGGPPYRPPGWAVRLATALEHGERLAQYRGEGIATREMRKHVGWYARRFPDAAALRTAAAGARTWPAMREILLGAINQQPGEPCPQAEIGGRGQPSQGLPGGEPACER